MNQDHIARLTHDLMVTISDLSQASRNVSTADFVRAEWSDLSLASTELNRLVERVTPRMQAAE